LDDDRCPVHNERIPVNASEPGGARPTNDYISDLSASFEIDPAKAALIVVDMQDATGSRKAGLGKRLTEEGKLDTLARERFDRIENVVVPNLRRMLAFFREKGLRVIYITFGSEMEDYSDAPAHMVRFFQGTNNRKRELEHEIVEEVKPHPGEPVLNKTTISAFTSTGIDSLLRSMAIKYLLFAGMSTNTCVGTTARDAADCGYHCLLIEDCCGEAQNEYHRWEVVNFQRFFGRVDGSENVMTEIKGNLKHVSSRS
jgi:nicotinamidase-related amidase